MKAIKIVLEQDELMKSHVNMSTIYVSEDMLSVDEVKSRLESFGLSGKDLTWLRWSCGTGEHNTARKLSSGIPLHWCSAQYFHL